MYEFKMYLFDNGDPEGLLFFVKFFNMALKASGMLAANAKLQYLLNILYREVPLQFYTLFVQV